MHTLHDQVEVVSQMLVWQKFGEAGECEHVKLIKHGENSMPNQLME